MANKSRTVEKKVAPTTSAYTDAVGGHFHVLVTNAQDQVIASIPVVTQAPAQSLADAYASAGFNNR